MRANPEKNRSQLMGRSVAIALAATAVLLAASVVQADTIFPRSGEPIARVKIRQATYEQISYKLPRISTVQRMSSDDVARIEWDENGALKNARGQIQQGEYAKAVTRLSRYLNSADPRIAANASYLSGVALLAAGAADRSQYSAAVTAFQAYLSRFEKEKDFYVPQAYVRMAEAHRRAGNYSEAENALSKLKSGGMGKAWVIGAKLGLAEVQLAQEKFEQARDLFADLTTDATVQEDPVFKAKALLGYARCQLGQGQNQAAIKTLSDKLLGGKSARFDHFAADAFLVWGQAESKLAGSDKKKQQWALIRFLRASSLAPAGSDSLAEAYYRASEMWKSLGKQDRAQELRQRILKECPNSPWAKK